MIWSNTIEEHEHNVRLILRALQTAKLYVNPKKCKLFCTEIHFLGHKISQKGIEADEGKADRILQWPRPKSAQEVHSFLGLVRYLAAFLPKLAEYTNILGHLTHQEAESHFPIWTDEHQMAFDSIKQLVASRDCLTTIDFTKMPDSKIFVTTDTSDIRSGAVLSFGESWETARPVAFESWTFKGAELNYPVHEKEMLAIIRALKKWRTDLIGVPFVIYTDHKTLENFDTQRDLSRRQARWMEFLSQYDGKIVYVKGEENTVADALSRLPATYSSNSSVADTVAQAPYDTTTASVLQGNENEPLKMVAALARAVTSIEPAGKDRKVNTLTRISADGALLTQIQKGYETDPWIKSLEKAAPGMLNITK